MVNRACSMENMVIDMPINPSFWRNKNVFVTGHTGFKGSWLCLWLHELGSRVTGFSLEPPTQPSLYEIARIGELVHSVPGDVRDLAALKKALFEAKPDIVIHMAAQPLVRDSYRNPVDTYTVNVLGTVHLFEAVRQAMEEGIGIKAVVNVTTDKCYENKEWLWAYREIDAMGGYDPYSSSKGCSELVTLAYRSSFFHPERYEKHGVAVASARAGNVIGGGDWASDRLIPDCIHCLLKGEAVPVRRPNAIRPWQHVLEPLSGYLILAEKLVLQGAQFAQSWNFGPYDDDAKPVEWVVRELCEKWGRNASYRIEPADTLHEAHYLKLDCSKARLWLGWRPTWRLTEAIDKIVEWARAYESGQEMRTLCFKQINEYLKGEIQP